MPTVPYNPVPTVSPEAPGLPYLSSGAATPEAFGAGVGRAVEQLGGTVAEAGVRQKQIQSTTDANNNFIGYATDEGNALNDFHMKFGKDANENLPEFQQTIQGLRQKWLEGLSPGARRIADNEISRRAAYALIDAGRHAAQQQFEFDKGSRNAMVGMAQRNINSDNPYDAKRFNENLQTAKDNTVSANKLVGVDEGDADTQLKIRTEVSKAWAGRIANMAVTFHDPDGATKLYNANKSFMDDPTRRQIENLLIQTRMNYRSTDRVQQVLGGQSYEQMTKGEQEGEKLDDEVEEANKADLATKEITPTEQNVSMAHLFGIAGAAKFIKAMDANPNAPAAEVMKTSDPANDPVTRNHDTFFEKETGRPYTLREVFENRTGRRGLEGRVTPEQEEASVALGRQIAEHDDPGNEPYAKKVEDGIRSAFTHQRQFIERQDNDNLQQVVSFVKGNGDESKKITNPSQLQQDPNQFRRYLDLPQQLKDQVDAQIKTNGDPDNQMTPARELVYQWARGLETADPARFKDQKRFNPYALDLPEGLKHELFNRQQTAIAGQSKAGVHSDINTYLGDAQIRQQLKSIGLTNIPQDDALKNRNYSQLLGALDETLTEYKDQNNGKPMPMEEARKKMSGLIARQVESSFWSWPPYAPTHSGARSFAVPSSFRTREHEDWIRRDIGADPTEIDWGKYYYKWREAVRKQNAG